MSTFDDEIVLNCLPVGPQDSCIGYSTSVLRFTVHFKFINMISYFQSINAD